MTQLLCRAILFDMDGTLVDSTAAVEYFWRKWSVEHNLDPEYVLANSHGYRTADTIRLVAPHLDADREAHLIETVEAEDLRGLVAIPGARDLVASLPADRWAVVTSATRELAAARIAYTGFPKPSVLIGSNDVTRGKPDPQPFAKAAGLLGIDPRDCLVVEDTPAGLKAGAAAGAYTLGITTTYPAEVLPSELIVRDLTQVRILPGDPFTVEINA